MEPRYGQQRKDDGRINMRPTRIVMGLGMCLLVACSDSDAADNANNANANSNSNSNSNPSSNNGHYCGNDELDAGENCDGSDFGIASCKSMGFTAGELICDDQCVIESSLCTRCSDGTAEGTLGQVGYEACDSSDLRGQDCTDLGYSFPCTLTCTSTCTFDESACNCTQ